MAAAAGEPATAAKETAAGIVHIGSKQTDKLGFGGAAKGRGWLGALAPSFTRGPARPKGERRGSPSPPMACFHVPQEIRAPPSGVPVGHTGHFNQGMIASGNH